MRYFYDTEFIDDGRTIDLISIGVAAEDGRDDRLEFVAGTGSGLRGGGAGGGERLRP